MSVIDASVYIALINRHESAHQSSWAWLQQIRAQKAPLAAPSILVAEAAAALSRGLGDQPLAYRVISRLLNSHLIELVPVTVLLAERAAQIAADYQIRGCDAVYVALAEQLGVELVTLDTQQLTRSTAVVSVRRP
jgi:predicted nucleic acid-binding protein